MSSKDIKRELFVLSTPDYFYLKEYFEDMAKKGWLIDKIKWNIATYKRIEPADLNFSVAVYPGLSMTEFVVKDEVESYKNRYENIGWSHAISAGNFHVFFSNKEDNMAPIQSDEEIKMMIEKKSIPPQIISTLFWILAIILNIWIHLPYEYDDLFSNMGLILPLIWPVLLIDTLFTHGGDIFWFVRAKKNIKLNKSLPKINFKRKKFIGSITFVCMLILIIGAIIAIFLDTIINPRRIVWFIIPVIGVVAIRYTYKNEIVKLEISKFSKILLLVFGVIIMFVISIFTGIVISGSNDENLQPGHIGFTHEDFDLETKTDHISVYKEGSVLVPIYFNYLELPGEVHLETTYIEARDDKISKYVFDEMIADELRRNSRWDEVLSDASNEYMEFNQAYYLGNPNANINNNSLFLLKDNIILFLDTDLDLSEGKHINIITNKIDL